MQEFDSVTVESPLSKVTANGTLGISCGYCKICGLAVVWQTCNLVVVCPVQCRYCNDAGRRFCMYLLGNWIDWTKHAK